MLHKEEVRAQLEQALGRTEELQWEGIELDGRSAVASLFWPGIYTILVSHASGEHPPTSAPGACKPTDLVIISRAAVAEATAQAWAREPHAICFVRSLRELEDRSLGLVCELCAPEGSALHAALLGEQHAPQHAGAWRMAPLGNAATSSRVWRALRACASAPVPRLLGVCLPARPADFRPPELQGVEAALARAPPLARLWRALSAACRQRRLNPSQRIAVLQALAASLLREAAPHGGAPPPSVQLVQGPPGTGKTSTIVRCPPSVPIRAAAAALVVWCRCRCRCNLCRCRCAWPCAAASFLERRCMRQTLRARVTCSMLAALVGAGRSVLMTAPTNIAVAEVATRYVALLQARGHGRVQGAWRPDPLRCAAPHCTALHCPARPTCSTGPRAGS